MVFGVPQTVSAPLGFCSPRIPSRQSTLPLPFSSRSKDVGSLQVPEVYRNIGKHWSARSDVSWCVALSEWWSDELKGKKCRRRSHTAQPERRKKATLVSGNLSLATTSTVILMTSGANSATAAHLLCLAPSLGPYIVYMLKDVDILEDWTAIKKVLVYHMWHQFLCL